MWTKALPEETPDNYRTDDLDYFWSPSMVQVNKAHSPGRFEAIWQMMLPTIYKRYPVKNLSKDERKSLKASSLKFMDSLASEYFDVNPDKKKVEFRTTVYELE